MSLEQAIHSLWASDFGLTSAAPAERLFTGAAAAGAETPYVVLLRQGARPSARTSSRRTIDETALRFSIHAPRLAAAKRIALEIVRRFDRLAFERHDVRCLAMHRTHETQTLEADGAWRLTIDFTVLHETTMHVDS